MGQATSDDLKDVIDFISSVIPFSSLDDQAKLLLARDLQIDYIPKHRQRPVAIDGSVYLIRTGAFEITDENQTLVDRLAEGECFGVSSLLHANPEHLQVHAIEDSLVYRMAGPQFLQLLEQHKNIRNFFTKLAGYRANSFDDASARQTLSVQHTRPVKSLIQNRLIYCDKQSSIREAAEIMKENKVSCLLLMEGKTLTGIVTDRDLRNRVVARALDVNLPVTEIATMNALTIASSASIIEAQLQMSNDGIHHLPVLENNVPIGVITATDIVRAHSVSIIHFVDRIFREQTAEALAKLHAEMPGLFDYWIQADVSPLDIGESLAVIADAFVRRAIQLAVIEQGEPPMRFTWLAFGSQARKDQSFSSDQDSGLLLEREPNREEDAYFAALTRNVCHLLDQIGYPLCPGNIMASNPQWRKTGQQWLQLFSQWVQSPKPEALLHATIFFDLRAVYGPPEWLEQLQADLAHELIEADIFFMQLTRNALRTRPPLGIFRAFIVNDHGEHEHELDIKQQGIALVNDMARILALAEGHTGPQTIGRLESSGDQLLQKPLRESLKEAWLQLNDLKLEYQARQLKAGEPVSNFLNPDDLSPLRRAQLKNAFQVIARAQKALAQHYLRGAGV
ncbi:DUF294 nucleotidyltransferase-like domain-containing protein [Reinekea marinisedimentorum]|uniref:CBS domain-containing protein n=1 Tax=Reinekea marinisedimentorum TaxID=230495 RepID=A0A4V6NY55_9GAMM|nr:DUF294 nucleotidyltransferase-like domain-containing protein [Reinekea marinisedimentorum]TCS43693.1 CBS domain-containing protein [Reinekea marinisedimentorum]